MDTATCNTCCTPLVANVPVSAGNDVDQVYPPNAELYDVVSRRWNVVPVVTSSGSSVIAIATVDGTADSSSLAYFATAVPT